MKAPHCPQEAHRPPAAEEKAAGQVWMWYNLESPLHSSLDPAMARVMDWTATYRRDSTIVAPYAKVTHPMPPSSSGKTVDTKRWERNSERTMHPTRPRWLHGLFLIAMRGTIGWSLPGRWGNMCRWTSTAAAAASSVHAVTQSVSRC